MASILGRFRGGDTVDFATAISTCFQKYATFSGRAMRSEYWYFVLFLVIASAITAILDEVLFPGNRISPLNTIFSIATFLPSLAAAARRLHDIDKSGWWQLLWLIPIIGWIIIIIWLAKAGAPGPNRFDVGPWGAGGKLDDPTTAR
jgi:uncharacterized membrane protein YhaH (DUF805 family)